jgi:hypothetical protein
VPIDPKRIEELKRIVSNVEPGAVLSRRWLAEGVTDLLAEREELIGLLREIEWVAANTDRDRAWCPSCKGVGSIRGHGGHHPNCRLAALIWKTP